MTFDYLLINRTQNRVLAALSLANGFVSRACGLLFQKPIQGNQALWITPCSSIHTLGMGYHIHAVFLDRSGRVLKKSRDIAPCRLRFCMRARQVIEFHHRSSICNQIEKGDLLTWQPKASV